MNLKDKFDNWRRKIRWNKQYKKGRWESLKSIIEAKRYNQIIGYMKKYSVTNPHILDIGCGDGVLNRRMENFNYASFLGIDFSKVSIEKAKSENFVKAEFQVLDVVKFNPQKTFDVIIFNEVFYYIHACEKMNILNRMLENLSPSGIIIVSIYRKGIDSWEYFKENEKLKELEFITVTTEVEKTYWKIGVYAKA